MRINKYLAEQGIASRRRADEMISAGRIKINGVLATLGSDVADGAVVTVDDEPILQKEKKEEY